MAPPLTSQSAQTFRSFYMARPDTDLRDEVIEIGTLYPGYRMLFYRCDAGSTWAQMRSYAKKKGYLIHLITDTVDASLTCDEFEAKWLRPSQVELKRDPLTDRKLTGWYDDEGYAFTHLTGNDHVPPVRKLSREERATRANADLSLVRTVQHGRRAELMGELNELSNRRKRGRGRRR